MELKNERMKTTIVIFFCGKVFNNVIDVMFDEYFNH